MASIYDLIRVKCFLLSSLLACATQIPTNLKFTDGTWAQWSEWAPCSATCGGGGVRMRARICQPASPYGVQICTRPGKVSTESEACALTDCGPDFLGVVPLGCWIIQPEAAPIALTNQIPGQCTSYCDSEGFEYGAMDQTITGITGQRGTCYCMNNYTQIGRSNRCNAICKDQAEADSLHIGYLCGFSGGGQHASVYATRENERGTLGPWSDWSPCNCATGERYRNRTCHVSRSNRPNCNGHLDETEKCQAPEIGDWTTWTSWSSCSLTCGGGGLQTRTRVCQGPCGKAIQQLCPFAGEIEMQEVQCGMAPCSQPDSLAFSEPVVSLGCWKIGEYTRNTGISGPDNNPGWCLAYCYPDTQTGYVALDMSDTISKDSGYCACLEGDEYYKEGEMTDCIMTCGGEKEVFPGYLCGSETPFTGSIYGKRGDVSMVGEWSAWSSCSCPRGQVRTRQCQLSPSTFGDCNPLVEPTIEVRECVPDPCVKCPAIGPLENGVIGGDNIDGYGAVKRFECNDRFALVGPTVIRCTYGGYWGADPPICQDKSCPVLEPIENGDMVTIPGSGGDLILFTCHDRYIIVGPAVLRCDEEGRWNGTQPLCLGPPQLISQNATMEIDRDIESAVNITCTFSGSLPIRVLWWVPTIDTPLSESQDQFIIKVQLQEEIIGDFPVVLSRVEIENITSDILGQYICAADNGAGLISGKAHLNALCGSLPPVKNGTITVIPGTGGRRVSIECNTGFSLIGNSELYCQKDGVWNSSSPICQASPLLKSENTTTIIDHEVYYPANFSCLFTASVPLRTLWWTPTLSTPLSHDQGPYTIEQTIQHETDRGIPVTMSRILIDNVTTEMDGLFVCAADNAAGVTSGKVILRVLTPTSPPEIPRHQLSTGEEYGQYIAIGLGILAAVLLVALIYCGLRLRRRQGYARFD